MLVQTTQNPSSSSMPNRKTRAHPDSGLTEDQTEQLARALLDKRRERWRGRPHLDAGRFTSERVAESEEAAAWDMSQSTLIDLAETERRLLLQIDRALRKLDDGTYGVSENSGEPIGLPAPKGGSVGRPLRGRSRGARARSTRPRALNRSPR